MSPWITGMIGIGQGSEYEIRVPGVITAVRQNINAGPDPSFVGDPNGMWNDDDPGTYVQMATFEHPDVSYASTAGGDLQHVTAPTTLPAGYGLYCRMRYSLLESSMRRPVVTSVERVEPFVTHDVRNVLYDPAGDTTPANVGPLGPVQVDVPLSEGFAGGMNIFLQEIQINFNRRLRVNIRSPFLSTIAWRTPSCRIHDVYLVIKPTT